MKPENIMDLRSAAESSAVAIMPELPPEPYKDPVSYLPVEREVDLKIEAEMAASFREKREEGYRMYLGGADPKTISDELAIPLRQVLYWADTGDWAAVIRKANDAHERLVRENVRRARLAHAEADARESLELGEKIRKVVKGKLEKPDELRSQDIKNYADAAKATGDLADHGNGATAGVSIDAGGPDGGGKKPLVVIFNGGTAPVIRNAN